MAMLSDKLRQRKDHRFSDPLLDEYLKNPGKWVRHTYSIPIRTTDSSAPSMPTRTTDSSATSMPTRTTDSSAPSMPTRTTDSSAPSIPVQDYQQYYDNLKNEMKKIEDQLNTMDNDVSTNDFLDDLQKSEEKKILKNKFSVADREVIFSAKKTFRDLTFRLLQEGANPFDYYLINEWKICNHVFFAGASLAHGISNMFVSDSLLKLDQNSHLLYFTKENTLVRNATIMTCFQPANMSSVMHPLEAKSSFSNNISSANYEIALIQTPFHVRELEKVYGSVLGTLSYNNSKKTPAFEVACLNFDFKESRQDLLDSMPYEHLKVSYDIFSNILYISPLTFHCLKHRLIVKSKTINIISNSVSELLSKYEKKLLTSGWTACNISEINI